MVDVMVDAMVDAMAGAMVGELRQWEYMRNGWCNGWGAKSANPTAARLHLEL